MRALLAGLLRFLGATLLIGLAVIGGVVTATLIASQDTIATEDEEVPRPKGPIDGRPRIPPSREGDHTLRGVVLGAEARPLAGASVRVTAGFVNEEATTSEKGAFTFERLPASSASLVVLAPGYRPSFLASVALDGKDLTITLSPSQYLPTSKPSTGAGAIVVTLRTAGNARAPRLTVAAVPLSVDGRAPILLPRSTTLDNPNVVVARLDALPPGHYRVLAVPVGASTDRRFALGEIADVDVAAGADVAVDLPIRWGAIAGKVTDPGGPVERAFVRVVRRADGSRADAPDVELKRTLTDADGSFLVGELPLGAASLEVMAASHAPWSRVVEVGAGSETIDVALTRLQR